MISSRAHAIVLALIVVPSATADAAPKTCPRELAVTETSLLKTAIRLQTASRLNRDEKCATYRTHADVVTKARQVFERCSTGRNRDQDIEQMDGALSQVERAIASICATSPVSPHTVERSLSGVPVLAYEPEPSEPSVNSTEPPMAIDHSVPEQPSTAALPTKEKHAEVKNSRHKTAFHRRRGSTWGRWRARQFRYAGYGGRSAWFGY
jgi:hypothetical protein